MYFKDNFSKQSEIYAKYRPHYPVDLYKFLASLTEKHDTAWDCGTGNGQAAIGLSAFYAKVIATDPSEKQINQAIPDKRVRYVVERAEKTFLSSNSIDLVTVANALHWFDLESFYSEAERVLKPHGILAAWCYGPPSVSPEIDALITEFHNTTLDPYWRAENRLVEKEYSTLFFPFQNVESPQFFSEKMMDLQDFIGYLNTWSAVQRFITENNYNPTDRLYEQLRKIWHDAKTEKKLRWKLTVKAGRILKK